MLGSLKVGPLNCFYCAASRRAFLALRPGTFPDGAKLSNKSEKRIYPPGLIYFTHIYTLL